MGLRRILKICVALLLGVLTDAAAIRSEPRLNEPQNRFDHAFRASTLYIRADFDGDRNPDTLIGSPGLLSPSYEAGLVLSNGEQQHFVFDASGNWLVSARAQDIDSDGDMDIVFTRLGSAILVFVNDGRGQFASAAVTAYPFLCHSGTEPSISTTISRPGVARDSETPQPGAIPTVFECTFAPAIKERVAALLDHCGTSLFGASSRAPPLTLKAV